MFSLCYDRANDWYCGWIIKPSITQHPLEESSTGNPRLDLSYCFLQFLLTRGKFLMTKGSIPIKNQLVELHILHSFKGQRFITANKQMQPRIESYTIIWAYFRLHPRPRKSLLSITQYRSIFVRWLSPDLSYQALRVEGGSARWCSGLVQVTTLSSNTLINGHQIPSLPNTIHL